jgi:SWI/SNF-related matrix-associated actin-dependent regulator of chromatin subfamily A-like protein 1
LAWRRIVNLVQLGDEMKTKRIVGENKLFSFQEEAVSLLLKRKHTLLAHSMGLGKTCMAIELINRLHLCPVLVICKASIKINWQRKILDWATASHFIQIVHKRTDRIEPLATIVIVNYDLITHSYIHLQLKQIKWALLICDEAHYLKNMKAQRTKAILSGKGLIHSTERSLMMTGTPVLNRPIELYPILRVLSPETIAPYGDYYKFARRYCAGHQDGFCFNDKGHSNEKELNQRLRQGFMIRRTYAEIENQLPKRRYEVILIEQTCAVDNNLRVLERAERTDFKHQALDCDAGNLATLRRQTAEAKIDAVIETIREYVESVDKLVIFAYHHSVIERLENELKGYGVVTLTGATAQKDRQGGIDLFIQKPDLHVFIGQLQAAGEGIDGLQRCCHNVLFVESSWVPGEISQAIARLWRLGQSHPVLIRFLVWANSIEEHMLRVALDKVKTIREITK